MCSVMHSVCTRTTELWCVASYCRANSLPSHPCILLGDRGQAGEIGGFDSHSRSSIVLCARISVIVSAPDTKESVWNHFPSIVAR